MWTSASRLPAPGLQTAQGIVRAVLVPGPSTALPRCPSVLLIRPDLNEGSAPAPVSSAPTENIPHKDVQCPRGHGTRSQLPTGRTPPPPLLGIYSSPSRPAPSRQLCLPVHRGQRGARHAPSAPRCPPGHTVLSALPHAISSILTATFLDSPFTAEAPAAP